MEVRLQEELSFRGKDVQVGFRKSTSQIPFSALCSCWEIIKEHLGEGARGCLFLPGLLEHPRVTWQEGARAGGLMGL